MKNRNNNSYQCRSQEVLSFDQVQRLVNLMEQPVEVHGGGNFPTLTMPVRQFVCEVRSRLKRQGLLDSLENMNIVKLNGSGASHVLDQPCAGYRYGSHHPSPPPRMRFDSSSSSHNKAYNHHSGGRRTRNFSEGYASVREEELPFNDIDLVFMVDMSATDAFDRCKDAVLDSLLEFLPSGASKAKIGYGALRDAYVRKLVKVGNPRTAMAGASLTPEVSNPNSDLWSLISLNNNYGRYIELKFVHRMRRQYEFSVDSFQIYLDSYLQYFESTQNTTTSTNGVVMVKGKAMTCRQTSETGSSFWAEEENHLIAHSLQSKVSELISKSRTEQQNSDQSSLTKDHSSSSPSCPSSTDGSWRTEHTHTFSSESGIESADDVSSIAMSSPLTIDRDSGCGSLSSGGSSMSSDQLSVGSSSRGDEEHEIRSEGEVDVELEVGLHDECAKTINPGAETNDAAVIAGVAVTMSPSFYPSVLVESLYGDFHLAMHHLNNRIIDTRRPEEIRGGGLLKYCNLLARGFRLARPRYGRQLERYMCSRFFIDFPELDQQLHKLYSYVVNHFAHEDYLRRYEYYVLLHRVVAASTVCLMAHERRLTLDMIEQMAQSVNEEWYAESYRLQPPTLLFIPSHHGTGTGTGQQVSCWIPVQAVIAR